MIPTDEMAQPDHIDHQPTQPIEPVRPVNRIRSWLPTIRFMLLCAALFFGIRTVAPTYAIEGESMSPTFHNGNRVILNGAYRFKSPHRGDVVVFDPPVQSTEPYIKRVIGLAGDHVLIENGEVTINGAPLDEPYLHGVSTTCFHTAFCDVVVPDGAVYVLGDNRPNSSDSRVFGPVDEDAIIGDVLVSIWPPNAIGVGS
ncbi:MAG TPA: signal peptidase I [Thermomicrobiales bacterium]|nr:signal peptidase I [Thermomicrobiales bacterium]